jgi:GNAT superfamily N-acetyltransferase
MPSPQDPRDSPLRQLDAQTRSDDKPKAMDVATSIRGARVADHAQLQTLFEELDRLHRDGAPWLLQRPDRDPRPLEWLETLIASHNSALFVADVGLCVGLATVHLRDAPGSEMFIRQQHAVIDDLVVHPDWRRRGIASRLYEACEEWALERNASWVEATVYEFNAEACDFYASVGFGTTTRRMRKPLAV